MSFMSQAVPTNKNPLRSLAGPLFILLITTFSWIGQHYYEFFFANIAVVFSLLLVLTSLTGDRIIAAVNVLLAFVATFILFLQAGKIDASVENILRLIVPLVA